MSAALTRVPGARNLEVCAEKRTPSRRGARTEEHAPSNQVHLIPKSMRACPKCLRLLGMHDQEAQLEANTEEHASKHALRSVRLPFKHIPCPEIRI